MTVRIIATGGTFDKHYDEIAGTLAFSQGHLTEVLRRARITYPAVLQELPFLDSLDFQDADRERVLDACRTAPEDRLVIIHGTDTMDQTAAWLAQAGLAKTIVLTGAMIPYEVANSDALFNFGYAFAAAQFAGAGVHIAMNGKLFDWDKVRKDRSAGVFVAR